MSRPLLRAPTFVAIDASSSGDNTLVAAVPGRKIRVMSCFLIADASTVSVQFRSAAAGAALTGPVPLAASAGFVLPYNEAGWFQTDIGELLNLELSDAVAVGGALSYVQI
jgi:hypothetical protein